MPVLLADLLRDLRRDHRNMSVLLDLLEREVDRASEGGTPDDELLCDIMRYLTVYSDAVHHPKEDLLYAEMHARRPEFGAGLDRVAPEHRQLAERGLALRNDVEAIATGAPVTRDRLIEDTRDYVATLRRHMAWEEEDLFRRARSMVRSEGNPEVDVGEVEALDPLFGPQREHAFANLLRHIRQFGNTRP